MAKKQVVTPEQLFRESGLTREEWNAQLKQKIEEAEAKEKGSGFAYALMLITKDGESVATKLAKIAEEEIRSGGEDNGGGANGDS